jgi:hypothetical protein
MPTEGIAPFYLCTKLQKQSSMNNKVYFAGSIRGGRADAELYQRIIDYIKLKDEVLTEHIGKTTISLKQQTRIIDSHIYERDVNWLCHVIWS